MRVGKSDKWQHVGRVTSGDCFERGLVSSGRKLHTSGCPCSASAGPYMVRSVHPSDVCIARHIVAVTASGYVTCEHMRSWCPQRSESMICFVYMSPEYPSPESSVETSATFRRFARKKSSSRSRMWRMSRRRPVTTWRVLARSIDGATHTDAARTAARVAHTARYAPPPLRLSRAAVRVCSFSRELKIKIKMGLPTLKCPSDPPLKSFAF
mgnify:CR=1 FL=1